MTPTRGLLKNRPILIGILIFSSYECVTLWLTITKYGRFPHDPVSIFGLAFAVFITASITWRSQLSADRMIFGAITATLVLTAVRMAHLTSLAMLAIKTAEALIWTIAAGIGLVALLRGFKISRTDN
jgi:hypothetical protein